MTRLASFFIAVCLALVARSAAAADDAALGRAEMSQLQLIANLPQSPQRTTVFDQLVDYDEFTHRVFGAEWDTLPPPSRARLGVLVATLIRPRIQANLLNYFQRYVVRFVGVRTRNGDVNVQLEAQPLHGDPIRFELVVARSMKVIVDVVTEGSSVLSLYRREIEPWLRRKDFAGLEERLRVAIARQSPTMPNPIATSPSTSSRTPNTYAGAHPIQGVE